MNTLTIAQKVNESKILETVSPQSIIEAANKIKSLQPKKVQSQLSINRSGYNRQAEAKRNSFDLVYKDVRSIDFNLPSRVGINSIIENEHRIMSKIKGLSRYANRNKKDFDLIRLQSVLRNKNLFLAFLTPTQLKKVSEEKRKFTNTQVLDIVAKICTMNVKTYERIVNKYNENLRLSKLRSKYANK